MSVSSDYNFLGGQSDNVGRTSWFDSKKSRWEARPTEFYNNVGWTSQSDRMKFVTDRQECLSYR